MQIDDIYTMMFYDNAVKITNLNQLDNLRSLLETNYKENCFLLNNIDPFEYAIKQTVKDDAISDTFNDEIIRKALELGFYPMSMKKRITKLSEIESEKREEIIKIKKRKQKEFFRSILNIRYHSNKLIIPFENLHITKKLKPWLKNKFSNYTLTFNKDFNKCIEEILKAYKETWLTQELIEVFKKIHENPDSNVSIDSVEIWNNGKIVAGEIGFITHNAYASLTGFHNEDDIGTIQMCILGLYLKNNNFAYWDLGMELEYKYRFGAISYSRDEQEELYKILTKEKLSFTTKEIKLAEFIKDI